MNRWVLLSLTLLFLAFGCATPAPPVWRPVEPDAFKGALTLTRSLELARAGDLRTAQWKARHDAARAVLTSARALPNPTASVTWEDVGLKDELGKSIATTSLGISYPIFFWWTRGPEISQARADLRAEDAAILIDKRDLAVKIGSVFFEIAALQKKSRVSQSLVETARESLRLTAKQHELGYASIHELNRSKAEVLRAEREAGEMESGLRLARLSFAFALGADRPAFPAVEDWPETATLPMAETTTLAELPESALQSALERDPGWEKAKAEREAAEASLTIEQRKRVPLTDASASADRKSTSEGIGGVFSFDIPIPLFNLNGGGIRKAEAALLAAQSAEEEARRRVFETVSLAWEEAHSAAASFKDRVEPLAQVSDRIGRESRRLFAMGEIKYEDQLQAERDAGEARLAAIDAWKAAADADWKLGCALGLQDPE